MQSKGETSDEGKTEEEMDRSPDWWTESRELFINEVEAINPNDHASLELFKKSLGRQQFSPLLLGSTEENQALSFVPGKDILQPQGWQLPVHEKETRKKASSIVLGVWFTNYERLAGKDDDKGIFVMDDITPQLEVFLQFGAILVAEDDQSILEWKPTRYQLVANLEDGSLWVLRKPFVSIEDAVDKDFATENTTEVKWGPWYGYGGHRDDRIVFGRLGSWDSWISSTINPTRTVLLQYVHCKRNKDDDPVLCEARRTKAGAIQRTNDFSF